MAKDLSAVPSAPAFSPKTKHSFGYIFKKTILPHAALLLLGCFSSSLLFGSLSLL
ncbi:hypothetical protein P7H25_12065 [Paenibacillus larvae]|nr:hypothetical protein [Paenibacillus larvae]MDT2256225.1 hypothetical protein [Paenibacillus larvae]MDT2303159.1 hypothetical protein [Paenibacillus larvae]